MFHQDLLEESFPQKSCRWVPIHIPFKRYHGVLNFVPQTLADGIEVDESTMWGIPIPEVVVIFAAPSISTWSVS